MLIGTEIIRFTDNAQEELSRLSKELRLSNLINQIGDSGNIPQDVKDDLRNLIFTLADMFGSDLPAAVADPVEALRTASRDINLARVLAERGLFRFYQLLKTTTVVYDDTYREEIPVPIYTQLVDPDTGEPFYRQEDFVMWFCREAKVSRALVFQRIATINRLLTLGFPLDEAYQTILSKPYAIQETLKELAVWHRKSLCASPTSTYQKKWDRLRT
jgi:hypothetical protein